MKTLIQGGWVIGFDGQAHEMIKDGVVVFEGNRIEFVGATSMQLPWTRKSMPKDVWSLRDLSIRIFIPASTPATTFLMIRRKPIFLPPTTWRTADRPAPGRTRPI